jgi:hypothetical protein
MNHELAINMLVAYQKDYKKDQMHFSPAVDLSLSHTIEILKRVQRLEKLLMGDIDKSGGERLLISDILHLLKTGEEWKPL